MDWFLRALFWWVLHCTKELNLQENSNVQPAVIRERLFVEYWEVFGNYDSAVFKIRFLSLLTLSCPCLIQIANENTKIDSSSLQTYNWDLLLSCRCIEIHPLKCGFSGHTSTERFETYQWPRFKTLYLCLRSYRLPVILYFSPEKLVNVTSWKLI